MHQLDVDGEGHHYQTGGEINRRQDQDEDSGRQLIAASTEHCQHDDITGHSERTEDQQQYNDHTEFDGDCCGCRCHVARDRRCRLIHCFL